MRPPRAISAAHAGAMLLLAGACSRAPDEPAAAAEPVAASASEVTALTWTVPPAWTTEKTAERGLYRARYKVPRAGDDQLDGELLVMRVGYGGSAMLDAKTNEWLGLFEGEQAAKVERKAIEAGPIQATMIEVAGTYRYPMGPAVGPKQRHAAHVIKEGWRGLAAAVDGKEHGKWFFQLVGPDDTVRAARSSFEAMLRSLR